MTEFGKLKKSPADDYTYVKIEIGSNIPIWRPSVFQTGSSLISSVDWDISSKFVMRIDFHHFERMQLLNLNSEVDFRLCVRHIEKSTWRHDSPCSSDYWEISQADAKWHAYGVRKVTIETGSKIPLCGRPSSETGNSFSSSIRAMQTNICVLKRVYLIEIA